MQRGLREVRLRDGCLPNRNLDPARSTGRLRFDPRLAALSTTPKEDQQTPPGPRILYRESYQLLDQPGKDDLARKCLRDLDHRAQIQKPGRRHNRARRARSRLFVFDVRIQLVKLPYLAIRSPVEIAVPGIAQVRTGSL